MPHVQLDPTLPGIVSLFAFRPETAGPLQDLAEVLLRGPSSLTRGERELIAAHVSSLNECRFCCDSHSAFAAAQLPGGRGQVRDTLTRGAEHAPVSTKLRALLTVAGQVQRSGRNVSDDAVAAARAAGATDTELHDTVLIAAAFCMFNRYVDGLRTSVPEDEAAYAGMAQQIVSEGYVRPVPAAHA